jgi:hypothetical protein
MGSGTGGGFGTFKDRLMRELMTRTLYPPEEAAF